MSQSESDDVLSRDKIFEILSSHRRRYILCYLHDKDEPVKIRELADQLAQWETQTDTEDLTDKQKKRVYVSIYQNHIPKLQESGIVTFNRDAGHVSLNDKANAVIDFFRRSSDDVNWPLYYLSVVVSSAIIFGLTALEVAFFGLIPETALSGVIIASLFILSLIHYTYTELDDGSPMP